MPKRRFVKPTEGELEILNVLWKRGPSTVRDVHDELVVSKKVGQTTILKLMQIMTAKGLVSRIESRRPQVYEASQKESDMQRELARDLLDRAFQGSAQKFVMQALAASKATPEELQAIREMLDEYGGNS